MIRHLNRITTHLSSLNYPNIFINLSLKKKKILDALIIRIIVRFSFDTILVAAQADHLHGLGEHGHKQKEDYVAHIIAFGWGR